MLRVECGQQGNRRPRATSRVTLCIKVTDGCGALGLMRSTLLECDVGQRTKVTMNLTPRQKQVLRLVAEGRSARRIGGLLNISPRTVEYHKYRLMKDLGLRTSAELIRYAVTRGLVSA